MESHLLSWTLMGLAMAGIFLLWGVKLSSIPRSPEWVGGIGIAAVIGALAGGTVAQAIGAHDVATRVDAFGVVFSGIGAVLAMFLLARSKLHHRTR